MKEKKEPTIEELLRKISLIVSGRDPWQNRDRDLNVDHVALGFKVVVFFLVILLVVAGYAFKGKDKDEVQEVVKYHEQVPSIEPNIVTFENLDSNLKVPDGSHESYMRVKLSLELYSENDRAYVEDNNTKLKSAYLLIASELTPEDLRSRDTIYKFSADLLKAFNDVLGPTKLKDVLLEEILIQ